MFNILYNDLSNKFPIQTTANNWAIIKFPNIKIAIQFKQTSVSYPTANVDQPIVDNYGLTYATNTIVGFSITAAVGGRTDTLVRYTNPSITGFEAYINCGGTGNAYLTFFAIGQYS